MSHHQPPYYGIAASEQAANIEAELAQLPTPFPSYQLQITIAAQLYTIDIWQLCFRLCFIGYDQAGGTAQVNTALFDETGDIDWLQLDEATQYIVSEALRDVDAKVSLGTGTVEH
ncbi:hypothetical protein [Halomicronema hongdechloris]|uniref:hypothetical protein n=1 Tax=Halomicronema hongdechloris TaxID=1209493 RepID=UPI001651AFF4|nr:hypothetical protein [Halomicronema hongdechloris]